MNLFEKILDYNIFGWSVSGNESTVIVKCKSQKLNCCFDIGITPPQSTNCDTIFVSHGHIDHIAGLPLHCRKRMLCKMNPAKYFLPKKLIEPMKKVCQGFSEMHECENYETFEPNLIGVDVGDRIEINDNWVAEVISTNHRTEVSLGYILYNKKVSITRPEIAYLGDTSFKVFYPQPTHQHLLISKIIITELTFIETTPRCQERSVTYGHTCLADFKNRENIFQDVSFLVFMHFSARYKGDEIYPAVHRHLPALKDKIFCLLLAQNVLY